MNKLLAFLLAFCTVTVWAQPDGRPNPFQDPRFCMTFGKTFMEEKCCTAPPPKLFDGPQLLECRADHPEQKGARPDASSFPTTCAIDCFFKKLSFYMADDKIDGDKIIAYFNSKTDVSDDIKKIFIDGVPKCLKGANDMPQIPHTCNTEAQFFSMCLYLQYLLSCPSFAASKPQCTGARKGLANCDPFYFPRMGPPPAAGATADASAMKHRGHRGGRVRGQGGKGKNNKATKAKP